MNIDLRINFNSELNYRETHLLGNLGWVVFDFGCSTLCLILCGLMGKLAELAGQDGGTSQTGQIKVNPTEVP